MSIFPLELYVIGFPNRKPKNESGDDRNSDDFNSDDIPTLEARITVSPTIDPTPAPAPIPSKLIDLNILVDLTFLLAFAPAPLNLLNLLWSLY